jgi:hypothetical protein
MMIITRTLARNKLLRSGIEVSEDFKKDFGLALTVTGSIVAVICTTIMLWIMFPAILDATPERPLNDLFLPVAAAFTLPALLICSILSIYQLIALQWKWALLTLLIGAIPVMMFYLLTWVFLDLRGIGVY